MCAHMAAALIFKTEKLANNNQFNYPQNIYCRIGFVIQTQKQEGAGRKEWLLAAPCARPFSRRFVVIIAWFSVCCFTSPGYLCDFPYAALCRCVHWYVSHRSAPRSQPQACVRKVPLACASCWQHMHIYSGIVLFFSGLCSRISIYLSLYLYIWDACYSGHVCSGV